MCHPHLGAGFLPADALNLLTLPERVAFGADDVLIVRALTQCCCSFPRSSASRRCGAILLPAGQDGLALSLSDQHPSWGATGLVCEATKMLALSYQSQPCWWLLQTKLLQLLVHVNKTDLGATPSLHQPCDVC